MHGLKPDDIKYLLPLRGAELIHVGVGEYQLEFGFHPEQTISVQGCCELVDHTGTVLDVWDRGTRSQVFRFLELLGETVTDVVIDSPRSFKLAFPNGQWLRIIDNSEQYESFSVGGLYI